jgi:hypothetical protein
LSKNNVLIFSYFSHARWLKLVPFVSDPIDSSLIPLLTQPDREKGHAFVALAGVNLDDYLCERYERVVGKTIP